jgi:hypothetical protein
MTTRREGRDTFIIQGWATFAIAHQLKIGQFLTFKKVSTFEYNVVIFDHTYTEMMSRCPDHSDATRCVIFEKKVLSAAGYCLVVSMLSLLCNVPEQVSCHLVNYGRLLNYGRVLTMVSEPIL